MPLVCRLAFGKNSQAFEMWAQVFYGKLVSFKPGPASSSLGSFSLQSMLEKNQSLIISRPDNLPVVPLTSNRKSQQQINYKNNKGCCAIDGDGDGVGVGVVGVVGGTQGRQSIEKFSIRLKLIRHRDD